MQRRAFIERTVSLFLGIPFAGTALAGDRGEDTWRELIEYARWSPSPHNIQPWRMMIVSATEAELYYDTARLLPATDPTSRFTITGLGMFIKCLEVAASNQSMSLLVDHCDEAQLDTKSYGLKFFAKLTLIESNEPPIYNRDLILKRKTSRLQYNHQPVDPRIIQKLKNISKKYNYTFTDSTDQTLKDFVLDLNKETLFRDIDDNPTREEISSWIRTTDQQAQLKKDGLWSKCMGFSGKLMHNFFFHHERFQSKWKRRILSKVYLKSMKGTTHIAWISGKFGERQDWVNAGQMLQELWLEMTKHNVCLHPFGSVITNPIAYPKFLERVKHDPATGEVWLLMRIGYSKEPPRSFRLTTNDILIDIV